MKMKSDPRNFSAARQSVCAITRVPSVLGTCLLLGIAFASQAHAVFLCGPLFETYRAVVRAVPAFVAESGGSPAEFLFEVTGGSPFGGTTLTLEISGTAANGTDYQTLSAQVTLPGGSNPRVTRAVVPIPDGVIEGTESVTVRIISSSNSDCIPVGTPNQATIYILDGPELSLAAALDNTNLFWTVGGTRLWLTQPLVAHDGVDAAQSGPVPHNQESWLETTVTGPGILAFWWKVSSEQDFDWLRFHIDGVLRQQVSGEVNWQQRTFQIPDGLHTLRWRYVKDLNDNAGQDAGWVTALFTCWRCLAVNCMWVVISRPREGSRPIG